MTELSSPHIVEQYLDFFRKRGHAELPGSPLALPGNSTSFIIAGMQPLLPYLRCQVSPPASRLVSWQRCLRTDDADEVGRNSRKATAFHMLGNWSIGDYGKVEVIDMALELLDVLQLDLSKLWVTVFAGDEQLHIPPDETVIEHWQQRGVPRERIVPLGAEDNLWTIGGGPGPCGPCTELYMDRGVALSCGLPTCRPGCSCDRFLEFWNLVFMEYELFPDGHVEPLPRRNIDTGMGLERMASILQGRESIFTTDLFLPAMQRLYELSPTRIIEGESSTRRACRVIVDHTRAALLAILSGVEPGRDGRNSVVRRLIRRAARQGRMLGLHGPFLYELVSPTVEAHDFLLTPEERSKESIIISMIRDEEIRFERVLTIGLKYLSQLEPGDSNVVPGERIFELHSERGFPADLAAEILHERGLIVGWTGYERAEREHQRLSRISMEKRFRQ